METNSTDLIADSFSNKSITPRNKLLPFWIKIFAWIFFVFGFLVPYTPTDWKGVNLV